ncbi:MAG: cytochrome c family protein, partial [Zoogloea sp.]|nr:cytochrome c family protein [Zoogloea sp.]
MKPALCLALAGLAVLAAPAGAADDADPGRALYEARCGGCHALAADRVGPR